MISEVEVWQTAAAELTFPSDRIDVWRVRLDPQELGEQDLKGILATDEVERASRFHLEKDRGRYIRGRATLRILLGRYLKTPPAEIRFQYENNGKPEVALSHHCRSLRFNVSNSGGLALIAVGSGNAIGVDIEKIRPMPDLLEVGRRFFSAREVQALLAVSENKKQEAFFAYWTRKEAFLKATGFGLAYPLSGFSVSVDPDGPAELCEVRENGHVTGDWSLTDIRPGEGFRGALAWAGGYHAESSGLHVNGLIKWEAIHRPHREVLRFYDFGEVPEERQGLTDFKSKRRAKPVLPYRYNYPGVSEEAADAPARGGDARLLEKLWQRMPLRWTEYLGK